MHSVTISHDGKFTQVYVQNFFEHAADQSLEHAPDFFFTQKRGFNIDLGELWLTVGAQVFVTKAFGDLVVTVVAGHHQQLLEQLRRLG